MTVPEQTWRESCACPGAEDRRAKVDRARARDEAMRAVQARAAGMSREQIKDLYRTELRGRGLNIPPETVLDAEVNLITGDLVAALHCLGQSPGPFMRLVGKTFGPPR